MKLAKLPTGKVLRFPDDTPDEAIDLTVQSHLKTHIENTKKTKEKEDKSNADSQEKHAQIMSALAIIAQLHHTNNQQIQQLAEHVNSGHHALVDTVEALKKATLAKRKITNVRDKNGKVVSSHSEIIT